MQGPTKGVELLRGDPKKAVIKLALPMIAAMSVQTIYNLVDALWVSGLGPDALSAVGFFFPFFFMIMSLAAGIGIGSSSAISRAIGAHNKEEADAVAIHTIFIMFIMAASLTIPFLIFARPIFLAIGAGNTINDTMAYSNIMFSGSIIIFFASIGTAMLRGEGDATRAMWAMMVGAILNIILDPFFIYTLDYGVAGAAMATILGMSVTGIILSYWLFIKGNTYIDFRFKGFKWSKPILKSIFKVGLPASIQQMSMSITMLVMNIIVVGVAGTDGVAVYTTGWRITTIAILPMLAMATGVVSVTGAAFGAKEYEKLRVAFMFAARFGLILEAVLGAAIFLIAPNISHIFTQGEGGQRIYDDLVQFLRITWLFYPAAALGISASATFQGTGKGTYSLIATLVRTVAMTPPLAFILAYWLDMGLAGVWWGLVIANLIGSMISFIWARYYIGCIERKNDNCAPDDEQSRLHAE